MSLPRSGKYEHTANILFRIPSDTTDGSDITFEDVIDAIKQRIENLRIESGQMSGSTPDFDEYIRNEVIEFEYLDS